MGEAKVKAVNGTTTKCCGTCAAFRRFQVGEPGGVCRSRAPVPIMVGMRTNAQGQVALNPATGQPIPVILTYFPEVPDTEYCLDYTGKLDKAALRSLDLSQLDTTDIGGSA